MGFNYHHADHLTWMCHRQYRFFLRSFTTSSSETNDFDLLSRAVRCRDGNVLYGFVPPVSARCLQIRSASDQSVDMSNAYLFHLRVSSISPVTHRTGHLAAVLLRSSIGLVFGEIDVSANRFLHSIRLFR